jgi:vacuolar-type H+-ATPase subunit F/Vma7
VDAFRLEHDRPLLVEVPGPAGPLAGRKTLRQLVRSAVGMCVDQGKGA